MDTSQSAAIHTGLLISRYVALLQGVYFLVSGIWPLLHDASFQAITGPKTDIWLVHTVGLFLIVVGGVLVLAALRRRIDLQITLLGVGSALALIGVELVYVFNGTISPVYLIDTTIELLFLIGWMLRQVSIDAGHAR